MDEFQESIAESLHEISMTLKDVSYWLEQLYIQGCPQVISMEVPS